MPTMPKEQMRVYMQQRRVKIRTAAIERLGGKCTHCGSTESLEFDHKDPATKVLPIAKMWDKSKATLEAELAKCQLLCRDCHIEKSRLEYRPKNPAIHGSARKYQTGCRCGLCVEARRAYLRAWRAGRKAKHGAAARRERAGSLA